MGPAIHHLSIGAVRADPMFVSALQRSGEPNAGQVRQAVAAAVRAFGGRGYAELVAQVFGDHPEMAVARMRWARKVAGEAFGSSTPQSARGRRRPPTVPPEQPRPPRPSHGRAWCSRRKEVAGYYVQASEGG